MTPALHIFPNILDRNTEFYIRYTTTFQYFYLLLTLLAVLARSDIRWPTGEPHGALFSFRHPGKGLGK